jgi:hypothetical protein
LLKELLAELMSGALQGNDLRPAGGWGQKGKERGGKDLNSAVLQLGDLLAELSNLLLVSLSRFALCSLELLDDCGGVVDLQHGVLQTHLQLVILCCSLPVASLSHGGGSEG